MTDVRADPFERTYRERESATDRYDITAAVMSRDTDGPDNQPRYRYTLERVWEQGRPLALWIMLNPSTANALVDDPTIGRVVSFSRTYGMGAAKVLNLGAYRATDPADMRRARAAGIDITGPYNDELLKADLKAMNDIAGLVIVAWGAQPVGGWLAEREAFIREHYFGAWCLGKTKDGHPKHPLYLSGATALDPW